MEIALPLYRMGMNTGYGMKHLMDVSENNPTITMNLEGLNSGVYVLRLIIDNQVEKTSQLIVK